jgi:hypothetical protein
MYLLTVSQYCTVHRYRYLLTISQNWIHWFYLPSTQYAGITYHPHSLVAPLLLFTLQHSTGTYHLTILVFTYHPHNPQVLLTIHNLHRHYIPSSQSSGITYYPHSPQILLTILTIQRYSLSSTLSSGTPSADYFAKIHRYLPTLSSGTPSADYFATIHRYLLSILTIHRYYLVSTLSTDITYHPHSLVSLLLLLTLQQSTGTYPHSLVAPLLLLTLQQSTGITHTL